MVESSPEGNASGEQEVRACKKPGHVMSPQGVVMKVPEGWALLPPGDAALTRRVKASGPVWVQRKRVGNKWFSEGIWADATRIEALRQQVGEEKQDPAYARKLEAGRKRRIKQEQEYAGDFLEAVRDYLAFHETHQHWELRLAEAVTRHATPVGSGTVARTSRIPIEQRAEAAIIAWMRHQTTAYDSMHIAKVAGLRREVRQDFARQSRALLRNYREGRAIDLVSCPLARALERA
jgi:hypothetical protein